MSNSLSMMMDTNIQQKNTLDVGAQLSALSFGAECSQCRDKWLNDARGNSKEGGHVGVGAAAAGMLGAAAALANQTRSHEGVSQSGGLIGDLINSIGDKAAEEIQRQKEQEQKAREKARWGGPLAKQELAMTQDPMVKDAIEQEQRLNAHLQGQSANQETGAELQEGASLAKVNLTGKAKAFADALEQVRDGQGKFSDLSVAQRAEKLSGYREKALKALGKDPSFTPDHKREFERVATLCMQAVDKQRYS